MRDGEMALASTGAAKVDPKSIDFIILKRSVDHDGHFKPVNATWAIDYTNFPLSDGSYELTASIPNLQQTYLLEHKFAFNVLNGVPQVERLGARGPQPAGAPVERSGGGASPGLDAAPMLLGLVALALLRRH
jgi:hypothetical protein